jgi:hypothetical protein
LGLLAFTGSLALGPVGILAGSLVLVASCALAVREAGATVSVFTWPNAIAVLLLIVWLVPVKLYRFPVTLPFNLEPYRLYLLLLVFIWLLALITKRAGFSADGHGRPLVAFTAVALTTQILNFEAINGGSPEPEALKSLSYFLGFVVAFLLITSTMRSMHDLDRLVRVLVGAATLVALTALIDSRISYNVFDHLHEWIPVLTQEEREVIEERGGRLRVYASAQHPIALGVALIMVVPLAIYIAGRAATAVRSALWLTAGVVCAAGALSTVSRTTVVMLAAMVPLALWLRGARIVRFWPLLFLLPVVVHFAAPGALGGLYKSLVPNETLTQDLTERAGQSGSGRFADIEPGLALWEEKPVFGHGIGSSPIPRAEATELPRRTPASEIIFDDQYLTTLVTMGALGLVAVVWLVWGAVGKLALAAKHRLDESGDLLVACALAAIGFAASMFFFDAFSFVQATFFFFVIAAIGFRARALSAPIRGS